MYLVIIKSFANALSFIFRRSLAFRISVAFFLLLIFVLLFIANLSVGAVKVSFSELMQIFMGKRVSGTEMP
jgi:ABC-type enterobactin transport system permease subunit